MTTWTPPEVEEVHKKNSHELGLGRRETCSDSDSASETGMEMDGIMQEQIEGIHNTEVLLNQNCPYVIIVKGHKEEASKLEEMFAELEKESPPKQKCRWRSTSDVPSRCEE